MTLTLKHRWAVSELLCNHSHRRFLGYAGEVDVWINTTDDGMVFVSAGPSKKVSEARSFNFDGFQIVNGVLECQESDPDLHLTPYDMCMVYALLKEKGLIND
jgi:hypothetical protein